MTTIRIILQALLLGLVVAAAARTTWVTRHHGLGSGQTASWQLYCLGRRWIWVPWVLGAACGAATCQPSDIVWLVIGFFFGHTFGPMSDSPPSQPGDSN